MFLILTVLFFRFLDFFIINQTCFFDLIKWKAEENPDVEIYLNRWDYPLFMAKEREGFVKHRWEGLKLPNLRYCEDNTVPLGASHHQKVVVVDDEGDMIGLVTFADLKAWLLDSALDQVVVASEVANTNVLCLSENDSLLDAIDVLDREEFERVEGDGEESSKDFRDSMLDNAPRKNKDFILGEKKSW